MVEIWWNNCKCLSLLKQTKLYSNEDLIHCKKKKVENQVATHQMCCYKPQNHHQSIKKNKRSRQWNQRLLRLPVTPDDNYNNLSFSIQIVTVYTLECVCLNA